jgi:hypothetical protein
VKHPNAIKSSRQPPDDFFVTVAPVDVGIVGVVAGSQCELTSALK